MRTPDAKGVGLNKATNLTAGAVEFDYLVESFDQLVDQVYFALIPMEQSLPGKTGMIEVGGAYEADPRNQRSPYRQRLFVPQLHYRDRQWHHCRLEFDFSHLAHAFYTIFGPRINEGLDQRAGATVFIRNVSIWRTD